MKCLIRRILPSLVLCVVAASCGKDAQPPITGREPALAASANQIIFHNRFIVTTAGVSTAYLVADTTLAFDDNTRFELFRVLATFYAKSGEKSGILTSRRGTYYAPTGVMVARGDVNVVSEDGRNLRTEELKYDPAHNEVSSDSAFVLTEPERRLEGIGFRSDPNLKNVHVLKVLSGSSGMTTIPNQ